jgi:hypothetical protein
VDVPLADALPWFVSLGESLMMPRRFIGAARSRALDTFPPIVIALVRPSALGPCA